MTEVGKAVGAVASLVGTPAAAVFTDSALDLAESQPNTSRNAGVRISGAQWNVYRRLSAATIMPAMNAVIDPRRTEIRASHGAPVAPIDRVA